MNGPSNYVGTIKDHRHLLIILSFINAHNPLRFVSVLLVEGLIRAYSGYACVVIDMLPSDLLILQLLPLKSVIRVCTLVFTVSRFPSLHCSFLAMFCTREGIDGCGCVFCGCVFNQCRGYATRLVTLFANTGLVLCQTSLCI